MPRLRWSWTVSQWLSEPADKDGAPDYGSIFALLHLNNSHMIGALYEICTQPAHIVFFDEV